MNDKIENRRPRWKPGQSGNLKGRPRGSRNRVTLVALDAILPTLRTMREFAMQRKDMMATRQKKPATPDGNDARKSVDLTFTSLEDSWTKVAQLVASPALAASRAIQAVEARGGFGRYLDTPELINCLRDQAAAVKGGDLALAEAMLMNQATTLQSLFSRLVERGLGCDMIPGFEANLRMALRAQSQCRATLETLAAIKNPPVVFARQANLTTGPQQINNGTAIASRALESESQQDQLSGGTHELLPDARAPGLAGRIDPAMATVGEIHRAEDGSGQGEVSQARIQGRLA